VSRIRFPGLLAALATAWLAACGVDVAGVGGEGTGTFAAGRVEGFGSVVVAGRAFDDADATVIVEIDPRQPQEQPLAALRLGMVGQLAADGTRVSVLRVAPELVGQVVDLDAPGRRFVAAGQTVQVDAMPADPTVFEGVRSLADLREGDSVEVHGQRDADGVIRASYIALTDESRGVRVAGTLRAVDAARGQWAIQELLIDAAAASVLPAGDALRAGQRVVAYTSGELAIDGRLLAQVIAVQRPGWADGAEVRLNGVIANWRSLADFAVQALPVDASSAVVEGGVAADVTAGRLVEIEGRVVGERLVAQRLRLVDPGVAPTARVTASIGNFVSGSAFDVRQSPIDASAAAFSGLSTSNLANGVPVRVTGALRGAALQARSVEAVEVRDGAALAVAGSVGAFDAMAQTIQLQGVTLPVRLLAATRYVDGTPADLRAGVALAARGLVAGGVLQASEIQFGRPMPEVELVGLVANAEEVAPGNGEFDLGPADVVWTAATQFLGATGTALDVVDGRIVRVRGVREGAVVRALVVDARATQPGLVRLRGTVTAFQSVASLRVDGQRVDASAAVFDPPGLGNALAGAHVDVEGTMVGGVLRATRVSDP
jgi:hypothetical protein